MPFHHRVLAALATGAVLSPLALAGPAAAAGEATAPPPQSTERLCAAVPADSRPFTDVDGNTFRDSIECLAYAEVTQGGPNGRPGDEYGPELPVTRAAMASFVVRTMDLAAELDSDGVLTPLPAYDGTVDFTDVPAGSVHAQAIDRLAEAGIVRGGAGGRPESEYVPGQGVNRAQLASFVRLALEFLTGDAFSTPDDYFTDDEASAPHEPSINAVAAEGIAVGDGADSYRPFETVARDQMSAYLARALAVLEADGSIGPVRDAESSPGQPDFTLTLLHANDQESALLPVTIPEQGTYGGADRLVTLIREQQELATTGPAGEGQADERGVLTVSAGDHFLPGPQLAASEESGEPIYDATTFDAADYDVAIFGNHDFDLSPDFLAEWLGDVSSETVFVSGNLGFEDEPALLARVEDGTIVQTHVEEVAGERIGIIGLTTPDLARLTSSRNVTIDPDLAGIANAQAAAYADQGVDKVIVISHLQDIDNEVALAAELSGVDVIVGAGGGELLADEGDATIPNGVEVSGSYPLTPTDADGEVLPVVTTPGLNTYLGRLVVSFDDAGELLTVHDEQSRPIPVAAQGPDAVEPDAAVQEQVLQPVAEYVAELAERVVAQSEVDLNGIRDDVRSKETNLGNLATDSLLAAGRREAAAAGVEAPVVALQNGGGIRISAEIPAGEVTALDTYSILPFSNFVGVAPEMPVETFVAAVERGLAGDVVDGVLQPAGSFAQAAGYRVSYDPNQPAGSRIVDLVLDDGTVLVEDGVATNALDTLSVATIDFLLRGGDGYPFDGVDFTVLPVTYQQALETYLVEDLNGVVRAADYPEGGEGRITAVG